MVLCCLRWKEAGTRGMFGCIALRLEISNLKRNLITQGLNLLNIHNFSVSCHFPGLNVALNLNKLSGARVPKSICCAICNANELEYLYSRKTGNHRSIRWNHPSILWLSSDTIILPSDMIIRWQKIPRNPKISLLFGLFTSEESKACGFGRAVAYNARQ